MTKTMQKIGKMAVIGAMAASLSGCIVTTTERPVTYYTPGMNGRPAQARTEMVQETTTEFDPLFLLRGVIIAPGDVDVFVGPVGPGLRGFYGHPYGPRMRR